MTLGDLKSPGQLVQKHGRERGFMSPVPVERRQHPNPWVSWRIENGFVKDNKLGHAMRSARDHPEKVCGHPLPNGGTCRNWKGFRTSHPGVGNCFKHWGNSPNHERRHLLMKGQELAAENGDPVPTNPEEAAQYLLDMTQFYVRRFDDAIRNGADLTPQERTVNIRMLQEFGARQTVLVLGLLKLGYRGELVGKDARRAVVAAVEMAFDSVVVDDAFRMAFLEAFANALDDLEASAVEGGRKVLGEDKAVIEGTVRGVGGAEDGAGVPYEEWSVRDLNREIEQRGLEFVRGGKRQKAGVLREDDGRGYSAS